MESKLTDLSNEDDMSIKNVLTALSEQRNVLRFFWFQ